MEDIVLNKNEKKEIIIIFFINFDLAIASINFTNKAPQLVTFKSGANKT